MRRFVIGISGSSSPFLGIRLLQVLSQVSEIETHLVVSDAVEKTLIHEASDWSIPKIQKLATKSYNVCDLAASISSGSFLTDGMIVMPCSMRTLAAIATAQSDNLLTRAADVTLKERRPLVLVPRETPLNLAHLRNMVSVTEMGGIMVPPMLAFYHQPQKLSDLVDHTVGKVLDVLKIKHELFSRWGN